MQHTLSHRSLRWMPYGRWSDCIQWVKAHAPNSDVDNLDIILIKYSFSTPLLDTPSQSFLLALLLPSPLCQKSPSYLLWLLALFVSSSGPNLEWQIRQSFSPLSPC